LEIEFENNGGGFAMVATAKKLGGIHKVFEDATPFDKTCLIRADKEGDKRPQSVSEDFRKGFHKSGLE